MRALLRAAGGAVLGTVVGAVRLAGQIEIPRSPVRVLLQVSVATDVPAPVAADRVRQEAAAALARTPSSR